MQCYSLVRNRNEVLEFTGEVLVQLNDREWLGATQNLWTLTLYRTDDGAFILDSLFHMSRPYYKLLRGSVRLAELDDVYRYLVHGCGGPVPIAELLLLRARRRLRYLDNPPPPLELLAHPNEVDLRELFYD